MTFKQWPGSKAY